MSVFGRKPKDVDKLTSESATESMGAIIETSLQPRLQEAYRRGMQESIDKYLEPEMAKVRAQVATLGREYKDRVSALVQYSSTIYGTIKTRVEGTLDRQSNQIRIDAQNILNTVSSEDMKIKQMAKEIDEWAKGQVDKIESMGKDAAKKVPKGQ